MATSILPIIQSLTYTSRVLAHAGSEDTRVNTADPGHLLKTTSRGTAPALLSNTKNLTGIWSLQFWPCCRASQRSSMLSCNALSLTKGDLPGWMAAAQGTRFSLIPLGQALRYQALSTRDLSESSPYSQQTLTVLRVLIRHNPKLSAALHVIFTLPPGCGSCYNHMLQIKRKTACAHSQ